MFRFLGSVNLFHGRTENDHALAGEDDKVAFVRPHDLDIERTRNGKPTVEAVVRHVTAVGPTVRVELSRADTGGRLAAELSRERGGELDLKTGETVHVAPRKMQIYDEDEAGANNYSI